MSHERCRYPFQSISIFPSGYVRPCCAFSENIAHIDGVQNISDLFYNNQNLQALRKNEILGTPTLPGCNLCYNRTSNASSRKSIFNANFKLTDKSKEDKLTFLDISFGNTCNLTCVMCSSQYSSKLRQLEEDFNKSWKPIYDNYMLNKVQVDLILEQLNDLLMIEVKGGEPFASKECLYFLEKITNSHPHIEIQITTNLTLVNENVIQLLKLNPNIKLIVSLDGLHKVYEWIRGIEFSVVEKKLQLIAEAVPNALKRVNFCVNAFNIHHLVEFDQWFNVFKNNYKNDIFFVIYDLIAKEEHMSPLLTVTPSIINDLTDLRNSHSNVNTRDSLTRLIDYCNDTKISIDRLKFTEWYEFINKIRGFDIFELQSKLI